MIAHEIRMAHHQTTLDLTLFGANVASSTCGFRGGHSRCASGSSPTGRGAGQSNSGRGRGSSYASSFDS